MNKKNKWDRLCRAHYASSSVNYPASSAASVATSAGSAGTGAARFVKAPDEAEHRAWLCGPDVTGARYVADFASTPMRTWPIREVLSGAVGGKVRLIALCDPDRSASDMLVGERFVGERIAPCLACTCALLRDATAEDPEIVVTYVDSARRRSLRDRSDVVGPEDINGGVTYHLANRRKQVIVYRREDACKVLVHELVHAFRVDSALWTSSSPTAREADRAFAKRHRVASVDAAMPVGLGEAYTEALACYLHAHWWARREDAAGVEATIGRVTAHIEDVGRRVDALCSASGDRVFLERTHAFAYAVCRAAIWSSGALPEMLERWSPGSPPKDPGAFARFVDDAIERWNRAGGGGAGLRTRSMRDIPRGLMMTPLQ